MDKAKERKLARLKRQQRIRKKVRGTAERPRLTVFRSTKHIYAQLIDDTSGTTLAAASTLEKNAASGGDGGDKTSMAKHIGKLIAERAQQKGLKTVVFDRNGFLYHGRVKAVSEGAREGGLQF